MSTSISLEGKCESAMDRLEMAKADLAHAQMTGDLQTVAFAERIVEARRRDYKHAQDCNCAGKFLPQNPIDRMSYRISYKTLAGKGRQLRLPIQNVDEFLSNFKLS